MTPTLPELASRLRASLPGNSPGTRPRRASAGQMVGLDIEPGHVVAAEVRVNGGLSVDRAVGLPLAPGVVRDGEVIDVAALADTLRRLFAENKLGRHVRVGLANQRIMVRTIELPPIADAKELEAAVRFRAQDEIPMPLDSVVLDFQSLGKVETPAGPRERVMLVAARRDMVERLIAAVHAAGLQADGVDLAAFALIRSLVPAVSEPGERVVYLSVGGLTNLAVAEGPTCLFTRVLGGGLETMATMVAERCSIPVLEARTLLHETGLADAPADPAGDAAPGPADHPVGPAPSPADHPIAPGPSPAPSPSAAPQEGQQAAVVARQVLAESVRQIASEVRNSLDYHLAVGAGKAVSRIVASGPALEITGFRELLSAEVGLPVELGQVKETSPGASGDVPLSRVAVAAGLAVAEVRS